MPSPIPKPRRLASLVVAAEVLDVCPRTVRRLIAAGDLPGYRVDGTRVVKVDLNDVEKLIRRIPAAG
ncbi:MAG: helix-turn-helix domain-containing protein [Labedaea sp.]